MSEVDLHPNFVAGKKDLHTMRGKEQLHQDSITFEEFFDGQIKLRG